MTEYEMEFCRKHRLTEDQFFGRDKIPGDLDLRGSAIPLRFAPVVIGGSLTISHAASIMSLRSVGEDTPNIQHSTPNTQQQ